MASKTKKRQKSKLTTRSSSSQDHSKSKKRKREKRKSNKLEPLDKRIVVRQIENDNHDEEKEKEKISTVKREERAMSCSWGQAFATASSIQPVSLGADFESDNDENDTNDAAAAAGGGMNAKSSGIRGNVGLISQIAREFNINAANGGDELQIKSELDVSLSPDCDDTRGGMGAVATPSQPLSHGVKGVGYNASDEKLKMKSDELSASAFAAMIPSPSESSIDSDRKKRKLEKKRKKSRRVEKEREIKVKSEMDDEQEQTCEISGSTTPTSKKKKKSKQKKKAIKSDDETEKVKREDSNSNNIILKREYDVTTPLQQDKAHKKKKPKKKKLKKSVKNEAKTKEEDRDANSAMVKEDQYEKESTLELKQESDTESASHVKRLKSENNDDDDNDNDRVASEASSVLLEGKLIQHRGKSIMVLINPATSTVYSGTERAEDEDGGLLTIGTLDKEGNVQIAPTPNSEEPKVKEEHSSETLDVEEPTDFPYPTDPDDHCESPNAAYKDILPILQELSRMKREQASKTDVGWSSGRKRKLQQTNTPRKHNDSDDDGANLAIYDPYFCNGAVISNLSELGFTNVYHKKEDCYKTWLSASTSGKGQQTYPSCDVLLTNPPYSEDHIERLMQHVAMEPNSPIVKGAKAWCLLMPTHVHKKNYYKEMLKSKNGRTAPRPFYLVPKKRYVYIPPKNFRAKKESDVHKKSSPFVSMWYIWGGSREKTERLIDAYKRWEVGGNVDSTCELARSKSALRDLRRRKR